MAKIAKKQSKQDSSKTTAKRRNQKLAAKPTEEEIALRAYHIYLERGSEGNPDDDWLQAERDLAKGSD